jgi:hypothetical protein
MSRWVRSSAELAKMTEAMRAAAAYQPDPDRQPVVLSLPFKGPGLRSTPRLGIPKPRDTLPRADVRHRLRSGRCARPDRVGCGLAHGLGHRAGREIRRLRRSILAPANGWIALAHDGEPDHEARRSPVTVLPYLLTQGSRLTAWARSPGNHAILVLAEGGPYVALAHLRPGSLRVAVGDRVSVGQPMRPAVIQGTARSRTSTSR